MKNFVRTTIILSMAGTLVPVLSQAQGIGGEIHSLQSVLDQLYAEMIPLCSQLIGVARGIAGFAALWYIASRVWRHLANAEAIDFYPLLRPFALGLAILLFPYVLALMNGVLRPTVTGTAAMMKNSNQAIAYLLERKEEAIKQTVTWQLYGDEGTPSKWYRYMHPEGEEETGLDMLTTGLKFLMAKTTFSVRNMIKQWLSEILQILYEAAALCINTIRTFYLIVLGILGPLVFGLAVFDGFQSTLSVWLARYINVYLWLPVANIFGSIIAKIQENMLQRDIAQVELYGDTFFSSADTGYIIFLVIAIIGYFTVPSVTNYIVYAGGDNRLMSRASNFFIGGAMAAASMTTAGAKATAMMFSAPSGGESSPPQNRSGTDYQHDKLSGKTGK